MIALSFGGPIETLVAVLLISGLNIYQYNFTPQPHEVACNNKPTQILVVQKNHKYSGTYFCPSYCGAEHYHKVHSTAYKCLHCNHLTYDPSTCTILERIKNDKTKNNKRKRAATMVGPAIESYSGTP
jgi:NADH pyrophosphatase NudC (nudix superfamily)